MKKRFDMYLYSITALVDGSKDPEAPFRQEELALHLYDQASHLFGQAQMLRAHSVRMSSLAKAVTEGNADLLEEYSRHCTAEAMRLVGQLDPNALRRLRQEDLEKREQVLEPSDLGPDYDTVRSDVLPFVAPAKEEV